MTIRIFHPLRVLDATLAERSKALTARQSAADDPVRTEAWAARFWMRLSISTRRAHPDDDGDGYSIRRKASAHYRKLAWEHLAKARALRDTAELAL